MVCWKFCASAWAKLRALAMFLVMSLFSSHKEVQATDFSDFLGCLDVFSQKVKKPMRKPSQGGISFVSASLTCSLPVFGGKPRNVHPFVP